MTSRFYHFYLALFISLAFLIIFFTLSAFGVIQSVENSYLIGEASRWCEKVSGGLFREPVNTLTNLGFMIMFANRYYGGSVFMGQGLQVLGGETEAVDVSVFQAFDSLQSIAENVDL